MTFLAFDDDFFAFAVDSFNTYHFTVFNDQFLGRGFGEDCAAFGANFLSEAAGDAGSTTFEQVPVTGFISFGYMVPGCRASERLCP